MNFRIVKKTDLKTGIIFFDVLLDGVFKKRFGSRSEAGNYIEQWEEGILTAELITALDSLIVSLESEKEELLLDDKWELKPC